MHEDGEATLGPRRRPVLHALVGSQPLPAARCMHFRVSRVLGSLRRKIIRREIRREIIRRTTKEEKVVCGVRSTRHTAQRTCRW